MESENGETEEDFPFEDPMSSADQMFLALHVDFMSAQKAGFSHEQAFELTRILWEARVQYSMMHPTEE